jgi:uncharacterized protein YcbX
METSAQLIVEQAASPCHEAPISEYAESYSAEWDDPASVRRRLEALLIPEATRVLISWSVSIAVETSWYRFATTGMRFAISRPTM